MSEIVTERLILRQWRDADLDPFAALNADPAVMHHFPAPLSRAASDALVARQRARLAERGWGLWAVEVTRMDDLAVPTATPRTIGTATTVQTDTSGRFIGFVGLAEPGFDAHFTPAIEIGWRLARTAWGHGYATEAARGVLAFGFGELGLTEIVSFTTVANLPSRRVMERLGMNHDAVDDFDHPRLPGSPIARHVLYRLSAPATRP